MINFDKYFIYLGYNDKWLVINKKFKEIIYEDKYCRNMSVIEL